MEETYTVWPKQLKLAVMIKILSSSWADCDQIWYGASLGRENEGLSKW